MTLQEEAKKVRRPGALWIAASCVVLAASVVSGVLLTSTVNRVSEDRLDIAAEGLVSSLSDQINGYRMIAYGIPVLMRPEGGGISLEVVEEFVNGESSGTGDMMLNVVRQFPLDGLVALAVAAVGPDGEWEPLMLPNTRGLTEEIILLPEVVALADEALESGSLVTSDPIRINDETMYGYAVPVMDGLVGLELVAPEVLMLASVEQLGDSVLDVVAIDLETESVIASTRPTPEDPAHYRVVEISFMGRPVELTVAPGAMFDWQEGWMAGVSVAVLGVAIAALVYVVGLVSRRRLLAERERLRLSHQSNEDKDLFIAAVSHELRTPLTAVVGLADILVSAPQDVDVEEVRELVGIMAHESNEMALLVEDLLVAARAQQGTVVVRPEPLEVDGELEQVVAGLGELASAAKIHPSGATTWADPLRMRQIIRNLIMNAARHGGPNIQVFAKGDDKTTVVEVCDDGPGISAEAQERMFEAYYRSAVVPGQAPSVGLGLAVAHDLAIAMDGELEYSYEEGMSVFRLWLPAVLIHHSVTAEVIAREG